MGKATKRGPADITRRQFLSAPALSAAALILAGRERQDKRASSPEHESLQQRLAHDPQRPQYHLMPAANWMNDPNGPIFWKGQYHMFYQYNPHGAFWGTMHWGHAVSPDMVHWRPLPVALAPTPGGPDKDGVFSGCTVNHNGVPTILYTGVSPEVQCLATGDPTMLVWKKYSGNPVIGGPPKGMEVTGFRDPDVWEEGGAWYMALGSGFKGTGGAVLLYRSRDLLQWEFLHTLCEGKKDSTVHSNDPVATGEMWECPDFFPLGDQHMLLVSTQNRVPCMLGKYNHHRFHADSKWLADFGGYYYAARSQLDAVGRRILWGWIREGRSAAAQKAAGWSGVMSLPRVLSLAADQKLKMTPASELQVLRGRHWRFENRTVPADSDSILGSARGDSLEVIVEFDPGSAEEFGLRLRSSPDLVEQTLVAFNRAQETFRVDTTKSSLNRDTDHKVEEGRFALKPEEKLTLQIFLDASVVEAFINERACQTARVYPTRPDSLGIGLYARGGTARLVSMDVWEMRPISKDRLTT